MRKLIRKFVRDDRGATAIEYGLIAGIVGVGIVASLTLFRDGLAGLFDAAGNSFASR